MIDNAVVQIIKKHYHGRDHNNDYDSCNLGFGLIHYAFIRNIMPERVLVIGSQLGYIPVICASACKDEGMGHVDFVDAGYSEVDKNSWGGVGLWKDLPDDYWEPLGLDNWLTLHCVRTENFFVWPDGYSYIYIDGDHSYEGVKKDYDLFWPYLNSGGLMVFHDIKVDKRTQWGKCGVKKFWDEIIEDKKEYLTIPYSAGLGIIKK